MNKFDPQAGIVRQGPNDLPRRACLITAELEGPFYNGGVGTTNRALVYALRDMGFAVDVLYTDVAHGKPISLRGTFAAHVESYGRAGIRLACIDHQAERHDWQARSRLALGHMLRERYDVVFFDDLYGTAYYPLLARRTGNSVLSQTAICLTSHSSTQWIYELNRTPVTSSDSLRLMEMERRSIELADGLRAPSAYLLRKYVGYGWRLPENTCVVPYFASVTRSEAPAPRRIAVDEFVFFGRLETRKGLDVFCRALDRLKFKIGKRRVTFLGKIENATTGLALMQKAAAWPFQIRLLNDFNRDQAVEYLKRGNRLAVMPSIEDNSPTVIMECLEEGIPFIASSGSGGEELLEEECREANLFAPTVADLSRKLMDVMENGVRTARPSFTQAQVADTFSAWLDRTMTASATPRSVNALDGRSGRTTLLVVVVPKGEGSRSASELLAAERAYKNDMSILAVAEDKDAVLSAIERSGSSLKVVGVDEFAESIGEGPDAPTVLGVCHVGQLIPVAWFDRAGSCFDSDASIGALTGLSGVKRRQVPQDKEPFVSVDEGEFDLDSQLLGYAPPLFKLTRETNSGFAFFRSEALALVKSVSLLDSRHRRLKNIRLWLEEILLGIHAAGHRFELVPDLIVERTFEDADIAPYDEFPRSSTSGAARAPAEEARALLTQMAVDSGIAQERRANADKYRKHITARLGRSIDQVTTATTLQEHYPQLAMLAYANGQVDLATDLSSRLIEGRSGISAAAYVRAAANGIRLASLVAQGHYTTVNLDHEWSLERGEDGDSFRLHANPGAAGRATIIFTSIDLSGIDQLSTDVQASDDTKPLRLRFTFTTDDRSQYDSCERVFRSGDRLRWEFDVPSAMRRVCSVHISLEMADLRDSAANGYVRLLRPRFLTRGGAK